MAEKEMSILTCLFHNPLRFSPSFLSFFTDFVPGCEAGKLCLSKNYWVCPEKATDLLIYFQIYFHVGLSGGIKKA